MERVAFLIEHSGERIGCLLNPESIVRRRAAGLRPRRSPGGLLTGNGLSDDQLIYTGGGMTELYLDLLFDVSVSGSTIATGDVRDLTAPLWGLAENLPVEDGRGRIPLARFIWGKSWNIPGVIAEVAERLEWFTPEGIPRRSWLRMRMLRVAESQSQPQSARQSDRALAPSPASAVAPAGASTAGAMPAATVKGAVAAGGGRIHEVIGDSSGGGSSEPLYNIAARQGRPPSWWKVIAEQNGVDDPLRIAPGTQLQIP
jgi:contractile injection system tube protein/LysM domain-containing protein